MNKSWDGKTPDWELEPTGAEQKEVQEAGIETVPSFADARIAEIAKEAKEIVPENPEQKAVGVETLRAEIAEIAKLEQQSVPLEAPKIQKENVVTKLATPKEEIGAVGKTRVFMKRMFGKDLTPQENAYRLAVLKDNFTEAIEKGDLNKALKNYGEMNNERFNRRLSGEQFSKYQEEVNNITTKAVVSGDSKTLDRILTFNMRQGLANGPLFTKQELGLKDGEKVSPEISKVATKHLLEIVKSSFSNKYNEGLENYGRIDRWVESGLISKEEFNKIPLVRDLIKKETVFTAKIMFDKNSNYGDAEGRFDKFLEMVTDTGVYTKEEVMSWNKIKKLRKGY